MPLQIRDGVAIVTIAQPPVNALGPESIFAIIEQLAVAEADPTVTAIVVTGAGGNFSGGADLTSFGTAKDVQATPDLVARIEASRVPNRGGARGAPRHRRRCVVGRHAACYRNRRRTGRR